LRIIIKKRLLLHFKNDLKMEKIDIKAIAKTVADSLIDSSAFIPECDSGILNLEEIKKSLRLVRSIVFSNYFDNSGSDDEIVQLYSILSRQIYLSCYSHGDDEQKNIVLSQEAAADVIRQIPELKRQLGTDVKAVFDADPAAENYQEVILCYPAIVAMTHYRFAHILSEIRVPVIPRMITEMAHSRTGIDIHPEAKIGDYFSIDHGTGVVIGQTCIIGDHVSLYQGVTLGAKSFKFDSDGNPVNEPRHPIIEDHVIIYSNTSVLGRITIGHHSIIGGNIWQTKDVPPYSHVRQRLPSLSK